MTDWNPYDLAALEVDDWPDDQREKALHAASLNYTGDTNIQTGMIEYNVSLDEFRRYDGTEFQTIYKKVGGGALTSSFSTSSDTFVDLGDIHNSFRSRTGREYSFDGQLEIDITTGGIRFEVGGTSSHFLVSMLAVLYPTDGSAIQTVWEDSAEHFEFAPSAFGSGSNIIRFSGKLRAASAADIAVRVSRQTSSGTLRIQPNSWMKFTELG